MAQPVYTGPASEQLPLPDRAPCSKSQQRPWCRTGRKVISIQATLHTKCRSTQIHSWWSGVGLWTHIKRVAICHHCWFTWETWCMCVTLNQSHKCYDYNNKYLRLINGFVSNVETPTVTPAWRPEPIYAVGYFHHNDVCPKQKQHQPAYW